MSHVDEGALHAYLDGALDEYPPAEARRIREHVETCSTCMDRLAAERRVRDDAHAILGLAAPEVAVPTFEELRAYVVRTSKLERSATSVRLVRLSWAASVVLALGTGWLIRGEQGALVSPAGPLGGADVPGVEQLAPTSPMAGVAASSAEPEAPAATLEAPALRPSQASPAAAGRGAASSSRAEVALAPIAAPEPPSQLAQAAGVPPADAPDFPAAAGAAGVVAGAAAPAVAAAPGPGADDARVAERIDAAARANQAERRAAAQDQAVTSALSVDQAPPALRQRAPDEQTGADEDVPVSLVVPGLEVLDVLPVGQGTTFAGMRALQRLESGDTLELVHLPAGIDPSLLPALRQGHGELVLQRGAGWLVLRAPVTERYLRELLQRLEEGR